MTQHGHAVVAAAATAKPEKVRICMEGSRVGLYMGDLDRRESIRAPTHMRVVRLTCTQRHKLIPASIVYCILFELSNCFIKPGLHLTNERKPVQKLHNNWLIGFSFFKKTSLCPPVLQANFEK